MAPWKSLAKATAHTGVYVVPTPQALFVSLRTCLRRSCDNPTQHGGFRLDFLEDRLWKSRDASALFTFSGHPGAYRMHSGVHDNNMLYFLGPNHQLDWVVWVRAVPTEGAWEVMELYWQEGEDGREKFKIKFFEDFFVKWAVSGFTGVKEWDSATEFILREI